MWKIKPNAFAAFGNLTVLDLSHNILFAPAVFLRPLSSLRILDFNLPYRVYPINHLMEGILNLKCLQKLAIATDYTSKTHVIQLQRTSITYLSINDVFHAPRLAQFINGVHKIERAAFYSWKSLRSLELNYESNVGMYSNSVFRNLSGLHVERGLSRVIRFHGFEAPNLKALAVRKTLVNLFDFGEFRVPTVQWLDISYNKLDKFDIPVLHQLRYLDISDQSLSVNCLFPSSGSGMKFFPESLAFINFSGIPLCYTPITCVFQAKYVNLRNTGLRLLTGQEVFCQRSHKVAISYLDLEENHLRCVNLTFLAQYDWSTINVLKLSGNRLASDDNGICGSVQPAHHMDFLKPFWNLSDLYLDKNFVENDLSSETLLD